MSHDRHEHTEMRELISLDVALYRALNSFCGWDPTLDRVAYYLSSLTGVLFLGLFGLLWFRPQTGATDHRGTLVLIVPAVALSLVLNRIIAMLLPFRVRPMFDIGANAPSGNWPFDLEQWSSFPSDNATYLFAIAASLWMISRLWGSVFAVFSLLVSLSRVYFGIHYPSDIVAGALLGTATAHAVNLDVVKKHVAQPLLAFERTVPGSFYAVLFMAFAEVVSGFQITRQIAVAGVHMFVPYPSAASAHRPLPAAWQGEGRQPARDLRPN
jgi:undecaprenyl-diphosphatase